MYNQFNFFTNIKRTVYKWWCVVYKPVYKLFHKGYWPEEKEPYYKAPKEDKPVETSENTDTSINDTEEQYTNDSNVSESAVQEDTNLSEVDSDTLNRANEIMERLAKEAAADQAKKQAEIDAARKEADQQALLDSVLKSTKVDISAFIDEGKKKFEEDTAKEE